MDCSSVFRYALPREVLIPGDPSLSIFKFLILATKVYLPENPRSEIACKSQDELCTTDHG